MLSLIFWCQWHGHLTHPCHVRELFSLLDLDKDFRAFARANLWAFSWFQVWKAFWLPCLHFVTTIFCKKMNKVEILIIIVISRMSCMSFDVSGKRTRKRKTTLQTITVSLNVSKHQHTLIYTPRILSITDGSAYFFHFGNLLDLEIFSFFYKKWKKENENLCFFLWSREIEDCNPISSLFQCVLEINFRGY